jgi:hypothetical protein
MAHHQYEASDAGHSLHHVPGCWKLCRIATKSIHEKQAMSVLTCSEPQAGAFSP